MCVNGKIFTKSSKTESNPSVDPENDRKVIAKDNDIVDVKGWLKKAEKELFGYANIKPLKLYNTMIAEHEKKCADAEKDIKKLEEKRAKSKTASGKVEALEKLFDLYYSLYLNADRKKETIRCEREKILGPVRAKLEMEEVLRSHNLE